MDIPRIALPLVAMATALLLAGCGTPGAPLPPTLDLPQPPTDLKATRKGYKVTLTWTVPAHTTDRALVKPGHLGDIRICRSAARVMDRCAEVVGDIMPNFWQPGKPASYIHTLPPSAQAGPEAVATYAVEVMNPRGRSGGLSNQVQVPLAPTFPAPLLNARVTADGPEITWRPVVGCVAQRQSSGAMWCTYRVRRLLKGAPPEKESVVAEVEDRPGADADRTDYVLKATDGLAEWEKTYIYRVTPITHARQGDGTIDVEGNDSEPVEMFAHDVFPPAVPSGVQAVYSGLAQQKFIDLTWAPVTDADLAGYNVYRHEEGGQPVKISGELVKTPAFRDPNVQPGHKYFYSVSAVDLRGNESAKSAETSEQVVSLRSDAL